MRVPPRAARITSAGRISPLRSAKLLEDLVGIGEPSCLVLGEDASAVRDDVEDAAASAYELCLDSSFFTNAGRQTGGLG
jgi:hypothetical protein